MSTISKPRTNRPTTTERLRSLVRTFYSNHPKEKAVVSTVWNRFELRFSKKTGNLRIYLESPIEEKGVVLLAAFATKGMAPEGLFKTLFTLLREFQNDGTEVNENLGL